MFQLVNLEEKNKIINVFSITTGNFFYFHSVCLEKFHSHLVENSTYSTGELRLIRHYHLFSKNDFQIPTINEHNQHFDDHIYNMRLKFSNLINGKTPFLKLEKDLKQIARLSLEDDFSLKKNFQAYIFIEILTFIF